MTDTDKTIAVSHGEFYDEGGRLLGRVVFDAPKKKPERASGLGTFGAEVLTKVLPAGGPLLGQPAQECRRCPGCEKPGECGEVPA